MDKSEAILLLKSLVGRLDDRNVFFELPGGRLSSDEVSALRLLCEIPQQIEKVHSGGAPTSQRAVVEPLVVNRAAFHRVTPPPADIRLCLDFGTAMSKAWATGKNAGETLPLVIGRAAGIGDTLAVPSSIYISDNGSIFLGRDAERQHRAALNPHRARFDNLKRLLSEEQVGSDLFALAPLPGIDPTNSGLTRGDLLVLYLAWLTDLCEISLAEALTAAKMKFGSNKDATRAVARRFAIPCFENADDEKAGGSQRAQWVRSVMSDALLRAQLLADTLSGKWKQLDTGQLAPLMRELRSIDVKPLAKLLTGDAAIREPIAAGASRFDSAIGRSDEPDDVPKRRFLMVVDAGAGTTDLALFQAITPRGKTETHYALLRQSVRMNRIAGNAVDAIFRRIALKSCGVDPLSGYPRNKEDFDYLQTDLDSQIRDLKQLLFETGKIEIELKPNAHGSVELAMLTDDPDIQKFGTDLSEVRRKVIEASFFPGGISPDSEAGTGAILINVLLTGGSARLPIISALAHGEDKIGGIRFQFKLIETLPAWIETLPRDAAQRLSAIYPQCAVAIGGSVAELPQELNDLSFPIMPPPGGKRQLEGFRIQGL